LVQNGGLTMGTNYIAPIWRMPENTNKDKLSNYSIKFESADYISAPNTTAFSISFWGKLDTTSSNIVVGDFAPWSGASVKRAYITSLGGEGIQFTTANGVNNYLFGLSNRDTDWHHYVVTYDAGTRFLYLDNSELATNTTGPASLSSTFGNAFKIGHDGSGGANVTNGKISQVCIFDYAIDSDQVTYLYNLNNPMVISGYLKFVFLTTLLIVIK